MWLLIVLSLLAAVSGIAAGRWSGVRAGRESAWVEAKTHYAAVTEQLDNDERELSHRARSTTPRPTIPAAGTTGPATKPAPLKTPPPVWVGRPPTRRQMFTRRLASAFGALALMVVGSLAAVSPAQAGVTDATWTAGADSQITGTYTVHLKGGNTSVETANLGVEVAAGTVVTFDYKLKDGAQCVGGAPRVFVVVAGVNTNSWDQNQPSGKQCGEAGKVTFTIAAGGTVGAAGVVFDNGGPGSVVVSNLRIGKDKVQFKALPKPAEVKFTAATCESPNASVKVTNPNSDVTLQVGFNDAAPSAVKPGGSTGVEFSTGSVQVMVGGKPFGKPYAYLAPKGCEEEPGPVVPPAGDDGGDEGSGGGLPVTGLSVPEVAGLSAVLLLTGLGLFLLARRRRSEPKFTA